jgi:GR25 family glycosyltransferase involved in LPS biosynthesis
MPSIGIMDINKYIIFLNGETKVLFLVKVNKGGVELLEEGEIMALLKSIGEHSFKETSGTIKMVDGSSTAHELKFIIGEYKYDGEYIKIKWEDKVLPESYYYCDFKENGLAKQELISFDVNCRIKIYNENIKINSERMMLYDIHSDNLELIKLHHELKIKNGVGNYDLKYVPENEYVVTNEDYDRKRPSGITGITRTTGDSRIICSVVDSWVDSLDFMVIVCDKGITDEGIKNIRCSIEKYPHKIHAYYYDRRIIEWGTENFFKASSDEPGHFVHYTNFAFTRSYTSFVCLIDDDEVAIKRRVYNMMSLIRTHDLQDETIVFNQYGVNLFYDEKSKQISINKKNVYLGSWDHYVAKLCSKRKYIKGYIGNLYESIDWSLIDTKRYATGINFVHMHSMVRVVRHFKNEEINKIENSNWKEVELVPLKGTSINLDSYGEIEKFNFKRYMYYEPQFDYYDISNDIYEAIKKLIPMHPHSDRIGCIMLASQVPLCKHGLESFFNQTYENKYLYIIIGSDDLITKEYINNYLSGLVGKLPSKNYEILYYSREVKLGTRRNLAIKGDANIFNCKYVANWDSDDIHGSNYLQTQIDFTKSNSLLATVLKNILIFDSIKGKYYFSYKSRESDELWCNTIFIEKDYFLKLGGYQDRDNDEGKLLFTELKKSGKFKSNNNHDSFIYVQHEKNIGSGEHWDYIIKKSTYFKNYDYSNMNDTIISKNNLNRELIENQYCNKFRINDHVDNIYVINLEYRGDRMRKIEVMFNLFGIKYERFNAIDGNKLKTDQKYINMVNERKYEDNNSGDPYKILGCLLSHLEIIKKAKMNKEKRIIIMEDDVLFHKSWGYLAKNIFDFPVLSKEIGDYDIVYFGSKIKFENIDKHRVSKFVYSTVANKTWGTHAYMINSNAYDKIIDLLNGTAMPIDGAYSKMLKGYQVKPDIFITERDSDIRKAGVDSLPYIYKWNYSNYMKDENDSEYYSQYYLED